MIILKKKLGSLFHVDGAEANSFEIYSEGKFKKYKFTKKE
jgi:hypothetical protein